MLTSAAGLAWAGAGELRFAAEPGFASVAAPFEARQWGWVGGGSAAFGLADQLWLELDADHSEMAWRRPKLVISGIGGSLVYQLDVLSVAPYLSIGLSRIDLALAGRPVAETATVATLGVGFTVEKGWLLWGIGVRYYALFESDLLAQPAYATVVARVGVLFHPAATSTDDVARPPAPGADHPPEQ